jgi:hypothetical protein
MISNRIVPALAAAALLGLTACNGAGRDDTTTIQHDTAVTTVPGYDTVQRPVQVPTQDTIAVEQQVEVHTDTVIDTRGGTTPGRP